MNLSIIIPVKNEARSLDACLGSIRDAPSVGVTYEKLVVDNGSEDETVAIAEKHNAKVFIVPDANGGRFAEFRSRALNR